MPKAAQNAECQRLPKQTLQSNSKPKNSSKKKAKQKIASIFLKLGIFYLKNANEEGNLTRAEDKLMQAANLYKPNHPNRQYIARILTRIEQTPSDVDDFSPNEKYLIFNGILDTTPRP